MEIVSASSNFDFKSSSLADPQPLTGQAGFYFTQLSVGPENKSLCLQLPECMTKQGIVNIKNSKYLDLMFERDKHDELMKWVEKLEYTCQDIIDEKKDLWFQTELSRDDIETMMTQITRLYQSGKYVLMRVFIDANKTGSKCIAYDENEIGFDLDTLEANKEIIPLVMIEGVKFSSRSFEISLKLVQVMVMGKYENKSACLIKRKEVAAPTPAAAAAHVTTAAPTPILEKSIIKQPIQGQKKVQTAQVPVPVLAPVSVPVLTTPVPVVTAPVIKTPVTAPRSIIKQQTSAPVNKPIVNTSSLGERTLKPIIKNTTVGNTTVGNTTVGVKKNIIINKPTNLVPTNLVPINLVKNDIEEININYEDLSDTINLKKPNEVYYEIYKNAREKAKICRMKAVEAYLEAKQIKTKYMLEDLDDSDDDDDSDDEDYNVESENFEE